MYERPIPDMRYLYSYHGETSVQYLARVLKQYATLLAFKDIEYDIFDETADFACKNRIFRFKYTGDSVEYLGRVFKPDHPMYSYMMRNWTYDINKYIMSKFNGSWFYIPKDKYVC